jgi:hypothetical protein
MSKSRTNWDKLIYQRNKICKTYGFEGKEVKMDRMKAAVDSLDSVMDSLNLNRKEDK